jgi:hypothetical protein
LALPREAVWREEFERRRAASEREVLSAPVESFVAAE